MKRYAASADNYRLTPIAAARLILASYRFKRRIPKRAAVVEAMRILKRAQEGR